MSECRRRLPRGCPGSRRPVLGALAAALMVLAAFGTPASATPPTIVLVWIDRAGLEAAAAPFGAEAQRSFGGALQGVTARDLCGGKAPAPLFDCVEPWGLLRVVPELICPAVQADRVDRVEALFATVARRRLVRGFVSRMGDTMVTFRLVRAEGAWDLVQTHRSLAPSAGSETHAASMRLDCRAGAAGARSGPEPETRGAVIRYPTGVRRVPDSALDAPTAVLVDGQDRAWVAHHARTGTGARGEIAVHERGAWRDASAGLAADAGIDDLHATPQGELFAAGRDAVWRWEGAAWVRRLSPASCLSPLRLTSLGPVLFGVCAYYPYYVAWPTRKSEDVVHAPFLADIVSHTAALEGGELFAIGEAFQVLLRLPIGGDLHAPDQWQQVAVPPEVAQREFRGLWSPAPARLVIVGTGGLVLAYDRGIWTVEATGITEDLLAVWGTETDGIYAAGAAGRLLYRGSGGWQVVPTGTTERLVAIHGRPGGRVVVVGARGAVLEVLR